MSLPPGYQKFEEMTQQTKSRFRLCPTDTWYLSETGSHDFDKHYTYHTAWAARKVSEIKPKKVSDFSSLMYFSTLVSAFVPVDFYDIRPLSLILNQLTQQQADLTKLTIPSNSLEMVSCMHVVEHIGLGRYGDTMDPDGDLKAIKGLKDIVMVGGYLLFVVPIGCIARVVYNAHRIYTCAQILEYFSGWDMIEFSLIPDSQGFPPFIQNATEDQANRQNYGCGCFLFKKSSIC